MKKSEDTRVCDTCQDDGLTCQVCSTGEHCEAKAPICDTCNDDGLYCHACGGYN